MQKLKGQCLCGACEYAVADAFAYAFNCHCSQCRRGSGAAFKPIAGIALAQIALTKGQKALLRYGEGVDHDLHCGKCGSLLYSVVRGGAYAHVPMGGLLDSPSIRPGSHIFVGSKAPWYEITDDLPQHETYG